MKDLYICNGSSNYVSRVNLDKDVEEKIYISLDDKLLGAHGIDLNGDKLYIATNDSYSFYEVNTSNRHVEKYYIGMVANDLKFRDKFMYLICSENNCLAVYDMEENRLSYEIMCGNYPHSIDMNDKEKIICITNMHNNQLTIVDYNTNQFVKDIRTGNLPMKSKFYKDGKYIFVCESNLGDEFDGTFSVYDFHTGEKYKSITLHKSPIDMFFDYEDNIVFVSNHLGNCVSVIDLKEFKEISVIETFGMPRGIYKKGRFLYIVISDKDKLLKYDIYTKSKEIIEIGSEPTCIVW